MVEPSMVCSFLHTGPYPFPGIVSLIASSVLLGSFLQSLFGVLMFLTAIFLILLVLIQRGRGGGLAGALGGMGGQSAFGSKAGDTFTRITVIVASVWITICLLAVWILGRTESGPLSNRPSAGSSAGSTTETNPNLPSSETTPTSSDGSPIPTEPASSSNDGGPPAEVSREDISLDLGAPSSDEPKQSDSPGEPEGPGP